MFHTFILREKKVKEKEYDLRQKKSDQIKDKFKK